MLFITIGAAFLVMLVSLSGTIFAGHRARRWLHERLSYLIAFSAGVFLVTGGAITIEAFHILEAQPWIAVGLVIIGYVGAALLEYLVPESHHHHDPGEHNHRHGTGSARRILIGDGVHNMADGIMLVPAFLTAPLLGVAVTVSIIIHETLQEISEFFVLKQAGYSTRQALLVNFLTSSTIMIGVALGYFAATLYALEGWLLALGAGFLFHVVIHDLLPRPESHETWRGFWWHLSALAVGLLLMVGVQVLTADLHHHEDHGEEARIE